MAKVKFCVITKCEDFADDVIELSGNQWRHYDSWPSERKCTKVKGIKGQVFVPGEILILDDNGREVAGHLRKPSKWGAEQDLSKGRCKTEFRLFHSLNDAIECARQIISGEQEG